LPSSTITSSATYGEASTRSTIVSIVDASLKQGMTELRHRVGSPDTLSPTPLSLVCGLATVASRLFRVRSPGKPVRAWTTELRRRAGVSTPAEGVSGPEPTHTPRWFAWSLLAVAVAALALRVAYVLLSRQHIKFGGDAHFYHAGANLLADGKGFIQPFFLPR